MKLTRAAAKTKAAQVEDVILFKVGAHRFAIAANAVDEIRNLEGLSPLPPALRHQRIEPAAVIFLLNLPGIPYTFGKKKVLD